MKPKSRITKLETRNIVFLELVSFETTYAYLVVGRTATTVSRLNYKILRMVRRRFGRHAVGHIRQLR